MDRLCIQVYSLVAEMRLYLFIIVITVVVVGALIIAAKTSWCFMVPLFGGGGIWGSDSKRILRRDRTMPGNVWTKMSGLIKAIIVTHSHVINARIMME